MLKDLLLKSRSYRGYDPERKISKDELLELVDLVRYCPSSLNHQPLKFYLVWEEEQTAEIQKATAWAKALKDMTLPHEGKYPTAFIIILQDLNIDENKTRFVRDVGITAQTILLGAAEKGLGGCMIGSFHMGMIKESLKLPENLLPMLVVALGRPDEEIRLVDLPEDGSIKYYRDENDVHYVPKRSLEDIVIC